MVFQSGDGGWSDAGKVVWDSTMKGRESVNGACFRDLRFRWAAWVLGLQ